MRRLVIPVFVGLLIGACGILGLDEKRVIGQLLNRPIEDVLVVPDAVLVGEPFTVTVVTTGGGNDRKGETEVRIQGNVATITPYDYKYTGGGDVLTIQYIWTHTASVRFVEVGEAQVIIRTRSRANVRRTVHVYAN